MYCNVYLYFFICLWKHPIIKAEKCHAGTLLFTMNGKYHQSRFCQSYITYWNHVTKALIVSNDDVFTFLGSKQWKHDTHCMRVRTFGIIFRQNLKKQKNDSLFWGLKKATQNKGEGKLQNFLHSCKVGYCFYSEYWKKILFHVKHGTLSTWKTWKCTRMHSKQFVGDEYNCSSAPTWARQERALCMYNINNVTHESLSPTDGQTLLVFCGCCIRQTFRLFW